MTGATGKGRAESGGSDLVLWVWGGWKQGDGMTVRVPVFSLHLRVAADGTVLWCSALENMSSCSTVPSGKMSALLGRTPGTGLSAWRSWESSLELCSACCLGSSAGAQGTEGCAQVVLQAGWWMGVFPRSGTKVQKLIMKYSLNVVGKTVAWLSGVGRFPEMPESSSQPPQGHTVGAGSAGLWWAVKDVPISTVQTCAKYSQLINWSKAGSALTVLPRCIFLIERIEMGWVSSHSFSLGPFCAAPGMSTVKPLSMVLTITGYPKELHLLSL